MSSKKIYFMLLLFKLIYAIISNKPHTKPKFDKVAKHFTIGLY